MIEFKILFQFLEDIFKRVLKTVDMFSMTIKIAIVQITIENSRYNCN